MGCSQKERVGGKLTSDLCGEICAAVLHSRVGATVETKGTTRWDVVEFKKQVINNVY